MIAIRPGFERDVTHEGGMAEFELIRVAPDGKFAPLKQAQFTLVREDRQYYWRFDAGRGWHSGYSEASETVQSGTLELKARTKLTVPVVWGTYRLEVTDPETKVITRYRFYAGWNAQDAESVGNRPDRVRLQLEGAPVKPGADVTLKINPPHDGEALVLVEADKVLWSRRVSVSTGGTSVTIPIDKSWNRSDMYISTVVFRPGSQGDRVTPARAVGMTWLPLAREMRKLKVSVTAPAQVEPEKRMVARIKVDNAAGKRVMVTLSAVDAGILNITGFASPDPFDFFFGKHRFGPELTDIYGKLIERMDGTPGKIKWGGDAGKRDTRSMPKKVRLVDLFSGPLQLNAKGEADVALMIPDFNGTLRLMAVAASEDAYGRADREVTVSAPIVAEIAMPRFIGPGDSAALALDVTNMMAGEQSLTIKLGTDKLLRLADGERTLKLAPRQRNILRFNVEATEPYGLSRLTLDVTTAGAKPVAIHREFALQIAPPVARELDARRIRIEPGASARLDAHMVERFYRGSAGVNVTLSNKPPINVRSIVKGLLDYPYGCLEQTTSAAYPHVFIDEEGAKAVGLEPRTREQRAKFIEGAIGRIAGMQGAAGGFRLWRGDEGTYESWLTPYVTSFLTDAREAGFNVPEEMTRRAQVWMVNRLGDAPNQFAPLPPAAKPDANGRYDWRDYELIRNSHQRFAELAHIGYMLAREQKASLASLRLLHDQYRDRARSPLPLVHLGIALALMGDSKRSEAAIAEAMAKPYGVRTDWEWDWLGDYGSAVRDQAMAYALLVRHKIDHPQRETMLLNLAERLGKPRGYFSTQERIALFLAARAAGGSTVEPWQAVFKTGDTSIALTSKNSEVRSVDPALAVKGITVENKGATPLWIETEASGFPIKPPVPNKDKIALERRWFTPDGTPWSGGALKVGDMLLVRISARSKEVIEDAMIVDHIPAGLEVENLNLSKGARADEFSIDGVNLEAAMKDARIKHKEYRDDRFVAALRLDGTVTNLFYMLRVVTPGRFQVPATFAEDMYRPEIRAYGTAPEPITVVDPRSAGK
jgi:alpha-2-macroglobulin